MRDGGEPDRGGLGARLEPERVARLTHRGGSARRLAARWSRVHAAAYRLTRGRFVPRWFGAPVMVLEVVGRRSGRVRATPLVYARDGELLVVCPSNGASSRTPAWWLNLRAAGEATAVVGGHRLRVRSRVANGAERERLWPRLASAYPALDHYVAMTERELPLVVLEPADG